MPEVDLIEVAKLCLALLMLALTVGVCALVAGMIVVGLRAGKGDGDR
jgi:hypothetical protein